jgi:hypothetical protein
VFSYLFLINLLCGRITKLYGVLIHIVQNRILKFFPVLGNGVSVFIHVWAEKRPETIHQFWVGTILEEFLKYNSSCLVITNWLVITSRTLTKDDLYSWRLREHLSSLQLPNDHYKPYDGEFRHYGGLQSMPNQTGM